jgi:hypothetical protein
MKKKPSPYRLGWIGIRHEKSGRASRLLRAQGWLRLGHADLNNRNAFDWVRPTRTREEFRETDWRQIANLGLVGIAVWISDAQWGRDTGITDMQRVR